LLTSLTDQRTIIDSIIDHSQLKQTTNWPSKQKKLATQLVKGDMLAGSTIFFCTKLGGFWSSLC
jgi:hypothetical protein